MPNSKKQTREARHRNYSFSSNQQEQYEGYERERPPREPLKETDIIQNYSPSRLQNHSFMKIPMYSTPHEHISSSLVALHQQDEIRKLEEVIFYLTGDRDLLKDQCASLHVEIATLNVNFSKEKEAFEAEIRKLKEIIRDKESQCESISKTLKKEKEIFEQENERMNYQLKATIEKKTDQIYAISRQKQIENQQVKRNLEAMIQQMKDRHKKELTEKDNLVPPLMAQINEWKAKYQSFERQIQEMNQRHEAQKLKIIQEHQIFAGNLKEGHHKSKAQIMQANKDIVKAMEENSEIQRSAFLLQIDHLRQALKRNQRQNELLQGIVFEANRSLSEQINGYINLISQLQAKLQVIHTQKQKEIEFLKIKAANLHAVDLQSAQEIFKVQLSHHADQLASVQAEKKRLIDLIEDERNKNKSLIFELKQRDSRFYEELFTLRFKNSQAIEDLKRKYEKEKGVILQQNLHARKETQSTAAKIQVQEEQLKKLRKLVDNRGKENEDLEKQLVKINGEFKSQKTRYAGQMSSRQKLWNQQREKLQQEISLKNKQILRLNNALLEAVQEGQIYQSHQSMQLQKQIKDLRDKLRASNEECKTWKDKAESLKLIVDDLSVQKERIKAEIQKDSIEIQSFWEQKCKEKIKDIEKFYQRKNQFLLLEKEQLHNQSQQQVLIYSQLQKKFYEIDNRFQQLLSETRKRTELQEKVIKLGLDTNLIKNKQQLFQY